MESTKLFFGASGVNRRQLFAGALATGGLLTSSACAKFSAVPKSDFRLVHRPSRIFKTMDLPRERTQAWFFTLIVESENKTAPIISQLQAYLMSGGEEVIHQRFERKALQAIRITTLAPPDQDTDNDEPVFWPLGYRLVFRTPAGAEIDKMRLQLMSGSSDTEIAGEIEISVGEYEQRTALVFPFKGPGVITQAGAANGGHRNSSGQFAVDAMGLTSNFGPQTGDRFATNEDLAGFGRPLVAPASGLVVHARGDRPDQPRPGQSDPEYHVPELAGAGDPGNHIVIDHGNGEFSMVAHLKSGTLAVSEGNRVEQGQSIGALGNSGDSFAPHVHYQLQDGPDWRLANGLPCRFENVDSSLLVRGEYFVAV